MPTRFCNCGEYGHTGGHYISDRQYRRHLVRQEQAQTQRAREAKIRENAQAANEADEDAMYNNVGVEGEGNHETLLDDAFRVDDDGVDDEEYEDGLPLDGRDRARADNAININGDAELDPPEDSMPRGTPSDNEDSSSNSDDGDDEIDRESLLLYIHLHQLYRRVGRGAWKQLRDIMTTHFGLAIRDGRFYDRALKRLIPLPTKKYDRCAKGHMAFTGEHAHLTQCARCGAARYKKNPNTCFQDVPVAQFDYIEVGPRLLQQYANATRAKELQDYHRRYRNSPEQLPFTDWTGGKIFQRLLRKTS
jgi:hypothetical protein